MDNSAKPQRKSPRLQGYDYSQSGAYFVTICTHERVHHFGYIRDGIMRLSAAGQIATIEWFNLSSYFSHIELDAFVIMPNHVHGIITIDDNAEAIVQISKKHLGLLSVVIGSYKSGVTRRIRTELNSPDLIVWQKRFHDHIIRDQQGFDTIREYVLNNPARWTEDKFYEA